MLLTWTPQAWEDYLYWQVTDKRTVKRINELLRDALRNPFEGLGKPEPLRFDLKVSPSLSTCVDKLFCLREAALRGRLLFSFLIPPLPHPSRHGSLPLSLATDF